MLPVTAGATLTRPRQGQIVPWFGACHALKPLDQPGHSHKLLADTAFRAPTVGEARA